MSSPTDTLLLVIIRRANLDAFWSSASSTVASQRTRLRASMNFSSRLGLSGPYSQPMTLPDFDHCGYEIACQMLLYSLNPGKTTAIMSNRTQSVSSTRVIPILSGHLI